MARTGDSLVARFAGQTIPLTATSDSTLTAAALPEPLVFSQTARSATLQTAAFGSPTSVPRLATPPTLTAARAGAYAGRYSSDELDTWAVVEARGDTSMVRTRWGPWRPLTAIAPDTFIVAGARVDFTRGRGGAVTGFRLSQVRTRNVIFERRP
ncbi:MAG: hypothetical protein IPJ11_17440 [Gemmatimonadetes bacterium]|nr:hypothetical protein [Gemmatimonadota bacterium]